jgi:uncharacterized protein DUF87/type IV secretory system conjugative DNA transfer VirD4/TraG family protein
VGATGSGKSELLKNLIWEQIKSERAAVVLLDPKGDLSRDVSRFADHCLPHRKDKLVYVSPFDFDGQTPVINPLQLLPHEPGEHETLVRLTTQELERTLDNIFSEMTSGFTGSMKSVLSPCLETLIRKGDADFWDLLRFMDDKLNGDLVTLGQASPNPAVRLFFTHSFADISTETKKGIEWRCRNLLKSQVFAGLTSGKTTVPLKQLIDKKCCIIFNLDKGRMGTEVSACFGKLIVSLIQVMAMQRGGLPPERKTPVHLYIDEFHNYTTTAIKEILAEARSNKLYLTLAQQLVGQGMQGDRDFKRILLGNTNVKVMGKSTQENCKDLADEFGLPVEQLLALPKYFYYVKVGNGQAFRMKGRDGLVGSKNAMSAEQWQELAVEQLRRYYVPAHKAVEQRAQQETTRSAAAPQPAKGKANYTSAKSKPKKEKDRTETPDNDITYPLS